MRIWMKLSVDRITCPLTDQIYFPHSTKMASFRDGHAIPCYPIPTESITSFQSLLCLGSITTEDSRNWHHFERMKRIVQNSTSVYVERKKRYYIQLHEMIQTKGYEWTCLSTVSRALCLIKFIISIPQKWPAFEMAVPFLVILFQLNQKHFISVITLSRKYYNWRLARDMLSWNSMPPFIGQCVPR
jgi:hypothetical protein